MSIKLHFPAKYFIYVIFLNELSHLVLLKIILLYSVLSMRMYKINLKKKNNITANRDFIVLFKIFLFLIKLKINSRVDVTK